MNDQLRRSRKQGLAIIGLAITAVALSGCGGTNHKNMSGLNDGPTASATPSYGPAAVGAHNAQDVTFATDMIPHHRQAVEMAEMALSRETDAELKALATQIKGAQAPEISQMGGWLLGWGSTVPPSSDMSGHSMSSMNGMMSADEMSQLDAAKGTEFAKLFLRGMTKHHQGAVAMARTESASGQNAEAKTLASKIITAQQQEIATMSQLMAKLSG